MCTSFYRGGGVGVNVGAEESVHVGLAEQALEVKEQVHAALVRDLKRTR